MRCSSGQPSSALRNPLGSTAPVVSAMTRSPLCLRHVDAAVLTMLYAGSIAVFSVILLLNRRQVRCGHDGHTGGARGTDAPSAEYRGAQGAAAVRRGAAVLGEPVRRGVDRAGRRDRRGLARAPVPLLPDQAGLLR